MKSFRMNVTEELKNWNGRVTAAHARCAVLLPNTCKAEELQTDTAQSPA